MIIRKARNDEYNNIVKFYHDLIDSMQNLDFNPGWIKDVYPTRKYIQDSIMNNELFLAEFENKIVSVMILNNQFATGYEKIKWKIEGTQKEIYIIHAFAVSPHYQKQGIARKMLLYIINKSLDSNIKAIRLDVLASNIPAQKLYRSIGFTYIDTIQLFYENTGMTDFQLYEFILDKK